MASKRDKIRLTSSAGQRDVSASGAHAGQDGEPMGSPPLNWAAMRGPRRPLPS